MRPPPPATPEPVARGEVHDLHLRAALEVFSIVVGVLVLGTALCLYGYATNPLQLGHGLVRNASPACGYRRALVCDDVHDEHRCGLLRYFHCSGWAALPDVSHWEEKPPWDGVTRAP